MSTYNASRSAATWLDRLTAHVLTVALIGVTAWLLLEDVLWHGAPFTGEHAVTIVAISISALFPRFVGNLARAGHYLFTGIAAVVMLAALGYIVLSSVDRTAEAIAQKAEKAKGVDVARANLSRQKAGFEILLGACPVGTPKADFGVKCGMREAVSVECASGAGSRCNGRKESVAQYEAQLRQVESDLRNLSTERVRRPYHALAEIWVDLFGGDVSKMETKFGRAMPALAVILTELSISVSHVVAGIGRKAKPAQPSQAPSSPTPGPGYRLSRRGATKKDAKVLAFVLRHRARHGGAAPSIADIKAQFPGIPTSTAARYRLEGGTASEALALRVVAG